MFTSCFLCCPTPNQERRLCAMSQGMNGMKCDFGCRVLGILRINPNLSDSQGDTTIYNVLYFGSFLAFSLTLFSHLRPSPHLWISPSPPPTFSAADRSKPSNRDVGSKFQGWRMKISKSTALASHDAFCCAGLGCVPNRLTAWAGNLSCICACEGLL